MHEGFVEHQLALGERGVDVAVFPLLRRLARGHAGASLLEVLARPLQRLELDAGRADIAIGAGVGRIRVQAGERIDMERQRLVFDAHLFEGILRGGFIFGGHQHDGRTDVAGLQGQQRNFRRFGILDVFRQQHADHARHLQGLADIDAPDAGMRIGTGQQAREHHAFGAEVLGILGFAGDLGHHVVRQEVLAEQLMRHGGSPRCCPPHA